MRANNNQIGMIFIIFGMLIYSFHDLAIKMIANETTIFQLFLTRALIGVIVTMICLKSLNYKIRVIPANPKLTLIRCVLMHFGFFVFFISLEKLSLSTVTALFFAAPFFITILSALFLSEKIGLIRFLIIIIGFIGVFLIVKPFKESEFSIFMLAPLFTALSYAVAMVISKYTRENENAFLQAFQQYSVSLFLSIITYIVVLMFPLDFVDKEEWRFVFGSIKLNDYYTSISIALLSIFGTLGMTSLIHAYQVGSPITNGPTEYILLILAIINGYFFFGNIPDYLSLGGIFLIILGGWALFFREHQRNKKDTKVSPT
jgi:S-adenosylmethionine uptake transporter